MATRKKTKLGTAGSAILKRTGGEALAVATTRPTTATKARHTADGFQITTIRFSTPQWTWLRRQALERSLDSGTRADASEIVRELVAAAMNTKGPGR